MSPVLCVVQHLANVFICPNVNEEPLCCTKLISHSFCCCRCCHLCDDKAKRGQHAWGSEVSVSGKCEGVRSGPLQHNKLWTQNNLRKICTLIQNNTKWPRCERSTTGKCDQCELFQLCTLTTIHMSISLPGMEKKPIKGLIHNGLKLK